MGFSSTHSPAITVRPNDRLSSSGTFLIPYSRLLFRYTYNNSANDRRHSQAEQIEVPGCGWRVGVNEPFQLGVQYKVKLDHQLYIHQGGR